jgi:hypothetical protein
MVTGRICPGFRLIGSRLCGELERMAVAKTGSEVARMKSKSAEKHPATPRVTKVHNIEEAVKALFAGIGFDLLF